MTEANIKIEGMSCQHCVMRVKKAVEGLAGVVESKIDIGSAFVRYDESKINKQDINTAIEKAGYKVVS